jgi:hypothetical protein
LNLLFILLICPHALAWDSRSSAASSQAPAPDAWSYFLSVFGYRVPEGRSYVSPTVTADRGWLHLEGRYNYENLETGSFWLGHNFAFGKNLTLDFTPMLGGVVGQSNGVAPGYLCSLAYRRFSLDSQGEYLFDTERSKSFFYTWSDISYSPVEWLRAGIAIQRTKAYQTKLDVQRGPFLGFDYKALDFTVYVFNVGWTDPTAVFALGIRL